MRKSIIYLATGLLLTSCADLDQKSISSIDKDNFYQSKEDIDSHQWCLSGVYRGWVLWYVQ